jgi:hypothetical protein
MNRHSVSSVRPRETLCATSMRASLFGAFVLGVLVCGANAARAQQATRRVVPDGEVSGLELALEGTLRPTRGGRARFLLTVYEVVDQRLLRPAPGATVRIAGSFQRDRALAELVTDALGRAEVALALPAEGPEAARAHHLVFDVRSPRRIRRRFELDVSTQAPHALELVAERSTVPPGAPVRVLGRLRSRASGLPVADAAVRVTMQETLTEARVQRTLRTDATGAFVAIFTAPRAAQALRLVALHGEDDDASAHSRAAVNVTVQRAATPALVVRAAPVRPLVEGPGTVDVDVYVRTADGSPVHDALITLGEPPRSDAQDEAPPPIHTDREGHARLPWTLRGSDIPAGEVVDVEARITALRVGAPAAEGRVRVRVARRPHVARTSVEGGALVPGVPGRVFVRVVRADGSPATDVAVTLASARLGTPARAVTDAAGFAAIETMLAPEPGDTAPDACGGATALAAMLTVAGSRTTTDAICLPVEPDGTLRVRPQRAQLRAGEEVEVLVIRTASVARAPVVVTLLAAETNDAEETLVPLTARVLPAGRDRVVLQTPAEHAGALVVRARPLIEDAAVGGLTEVRGGSATVLATRSAPLATTLVEEPENGHRLRVTGAGVRTALAFALDPFEAAALAARLRALDGPLAAALSEAPASALRLDALLAARAMPDVAAPAVLRDGAVLPLPAPASPPTLGVLRDPQRARARFVAGRLALVMHAIESHVATREPEQRDEVATRTTRGWTFNRELLDALTGEDALGPEGARGLDGLPLSMDALTALDPAITWDRMARRVTRKRLFSLLIALRALVREHDLDLTFAWRGEPAGLLPRLLELTDDETGEARLTRADLFDAWGRPFVIRPASGDRARFALFTPLAGFEVRSAGPDGQPGNADDLWDPLARVLPAGGAWATAVDEDGFLARARGVALGRATIDALASTLEVPATADTDARTVDIAMRDALDAIPSPFVVTEARALAEDPPFASAATPLVTVRGDSLRLALRTPDASGPITLVAHTLSADGARAIATRSLPVRPALRVALALPARLRRGETLTVPLHVRGTTDHVRSARVSLDADAPLNARLASDSDAAPGFDLAFNGAGRATSRTLVLSVPADTTARTATLRVQITSDDAPTRALTHVFAIDDGRPLRRTTHGALIDGTRALVATVPGDARVLDAALVLTAPDALAADPDARALVAREPALLAWADATAGRAPDAAVRAALRATPDLFTRLERGDPEAALHAACALVGTSADLAEQEEDVRLVEQLLRRVELALLATTPLSGPTARRVARAGRTVSDAVAAERGEHDPHVLALHAALATALAVGVPTVPGDAFTMPGPDRLASGLQALRTSLRARFGTHRSAPGAIARIAAALLLHRADDPEARAMTTLAAASLTRIDGRLLLPRDGTAGALAVADLGGTFALATAARQLGDEALLARLRPTLALLVHRALEAGGETAFHALAAGASGALGEPALDRETRLAITQDGRRIAWDAEAPSARIPLAPPAPGSTLTVTLTPAPGTPPRLARLILLTTRAPETRRDAPLALTLQGDPGHLGSRSALELVAANTGATPLDAPVLDVALPAGALADDATEAALAATPGVAAVRSADRRGVLRIRLAPLRGGERRTLPLTLRWLASGVQQGLSVSAWDEATPERLTVLPPRTLDVTPDEPR